jgi:alpha-beta hydrolase superfamily lysophospholipase
MAMQMTFNTFLQEDAADNVLQHLIGRDKRQMACVSRAWRTWVTPSSSTVHLCGPDVKKQLTWLTHRTPPRMLKVIALGRFKKCNASLR